jgi:exodeoxyribonuclease V alpha subunit
MRAWPLLRVAFPRNDGSGGVRFVLPSRLNEVETVFAMTVHKSQGSEFSHTALVLPDALNPVLTKELVYTGITRAKHCFSLIEPRQGVFEEAVARKVRRLSGLMLEVCAWGMQPDYTCMSSFPTNGCAIVAPIPEG